MPRQYIAAWLLSVRTFEKVIDYGSRRLRTYVIGGHVRLIFLRPCGTKSDAGQKGRSREITRKQIKDLR